MPGKFSKLPDAAGNGLMDRRQFLTGLGTAALIAPSMAEARGQPELPASMTSPGSRPEPYGLPAADELARVKRIPITPEQNGGVSLRSLHFTPLDRLRGTYTPAGLHFELSHQGVPKLIADEHTLIIHGMVKRPLKFSIESLERYPIETHSHFLECSGNTTVGWRSPAANLPLAISHGLLSGTQWGGVRLASLLGEAGVEPGAQWIIAEGADAGSVARSLPLAKALDDTLIALYQNGERLRPEQGYPMRLFNPGYEGNSNIKWLRSLKVTREPAMTRFETARYTDLLPSGKALQFSLPMEVKSVITHPCNAHQLVNRGTYEISGLAWSGAGRVRRVEVSADGGRSWADADLEAPVLPKMLTRFRIPWRWHGQPAELASRAYDDIGAVQPPRNELLQRRGKQSFYHYNGIHWWQVSADGIIRQVDV